MPPKISHDPIPQDRLALQAFAVEKHTEEGIDMTPPMQNDEVTLPERQFALTAAAQAFCNRGITIACPWEGDLDDEERERFEALVAAIDSYVALSAIPSTGSGEMAAKLVEELAEAEKPGRSKLMLMIAARAVRRGRHLTDAEKLDNVLRFAAGDE